MDPFRTDGQSIEGSIKAREGKVTRRTMARREHLFSIFELRVDLVGLALLLT